MDGRIAQPIAFDYFGDSLVNSTVLGSWMASGLPVWPPRSPSNRDNLGAQPIMLLYPK